MTTSALQSRIDRLARSTRNVTNARNPAQREAANKFLVQRALELSAERDDIAVWLEEADCWATTNMPDISGDQQHENNIMWVRKLREYEAICNALSSAQEAHVSALEGTA